MFTGDLENIGQSYIVSLYITIIFLLRFLEFQYQILKN